VEKMSVVISWVEGWWSASASRAAVRLRPRDGGRRRRDHRILLGS